MSSTKQLANNDDFDRQSAESQAYKNYEFKLHGLDCAERYQAEQYIHQRFSEVYKADINEFMPSLMTINVDGNIVCASGFRSAFEGPLFVEQYLDKPIEQVISRFSSRPCTRKNVMEIGNLASTYEGGSQIMFIAMTILFKDKGCKWVACNATKMVQTIFNRLSIETKIVTQADKSRLYDDSGKWGKYYDGPSHVLLANVDDGFSGLVKSKYYKKLRYSLKYLLADIDLELIGK